MSCLYSDFNGNCTLFDRDIQIDGMGHNNEGTCVVQDDPVPGLNCESFECSDCHNEGCTECDEEWDGCEHCGLNECEC